MENKHLIGAGVIGLMILLITLFIFQSNKSPSPTDTGLLNLDFTKRQGVSTRPEIKELSAQDIKVGTSSAGVAIGDIVVVHYIGAFTDGKKFDSSYDRKSPFTVEVGKGTVIRGFEEGVMGMKIGGKRRIFIPSELGYGAKGQGAIPPNSSLIFDVELLEIKSKESAASVIDPVTENPIPTEEKKEENNSGSVSDPAPEPQAEIPTETPTPSITPSE
ncbi:MAG: peptidyl-prolyl cis-trans isomerase [uncultured bacterium]|nr:MAG: peptidyl-prolyl cis-trans isomerase [uncultured bacterium]